MQLRSMSLVVASKEGVIMTNFFCETPLTGALEIQHIYEFYEEPRLFSAINSVGHSFLVYWVRTTDLGDTWYVIPISTAKLNSFENRQICIRDMLIYQEERHFIKLERSFDDDTSVKAEFVLANTISDLIAIPRQGLYISNSPQQTTNNSPTYVEATHEIHVQKNSPKAKKLVLNQVSRILETFSELFSSVADSFDIKSDMQPVGARPGSFILSFNAENIEDIESHLSELFTLMGNAQDIIPYLESHNIDVSILCDLLSQISATSTHIDLKRNSDASTILKMDSDTAKYYLETLNDYVSSVISSAQVPQANDLNKLFEVVEKRANCKNLEPSNLSLTSRQIKYYIHAASTLGFIRNYGPATALGQQLANASLETKMKITARSFQSSHCGWAWISWAGVNNITELDSSTATAFLLEKCSSLSESTSKRRATTLKKWCERLTPHYSEW